MKRINVLNTKWMLKLCFLIYIAAVLKLIVFKYPISLMKIMIKNWKFPDTSNNFNIMPFKTIRGYVKAFMFNNINTNIVIGNIIGNIVVFIPFGFLLPLISLRFRTFFKVIIFASAFIIFIETIQFFLNLGSFDVDDLILNIIGTAIGYFLFKHIGPFLIK